MDELEKIDIMVPTHGKLDISIQSVESIYQNTKHPFHLIIVDDSEASKPKPDGSCTAPKPVDPWDVTQAYMEAFAKSHKNVTYIHSDVPYKNGNQFFNVAIKNMETKYLATVMNSIKVCTAWDVKAVELMNSDPKIGCVGFKCLFPHGTIECAGIELFNGYMPIDIGRDMPGYELTDKYEVQAIQWAFALLRKEAIEGNLTEEVFYGHKGWDDIDNCFTLKSKGWKIFYCGFGVGIHHPRATRGDNSIDGYLKNKANGKAFWKRWGLWRNYMESKKMDVSDKVSADAKANISAILNEWQMTKLLFESRNRALQAFTKKLLQEELKVDPEKYTMAIDPARDMWDMKLRTDMEREDGKKDDFETQMKARQEAMAANAQPVLKTDNSPDESMVTGNS